MAKLDSKQVAKEAHGKWASILTSLGVDKAHLTNRHGACPMCRDGVDRFRFDDKGDGRWFCTHCPKQSGDGFDLLRGVHGWTFPQALDEVAKLVGTAREIKVRTGPSEQEVRAEMERLWKTGLALRSVDEAVDWWRARVGFLPELRAVKATPALRYPGGAVHPAMLAIVQGADGRAMNLHRTYLGVGGCKADVSEPRRVLALPMPKGAAVRLFDHSDVLGIAEGIETAVAAHALTGIPCWAALNTYGLENWEAPEGVRVVIFGDNDRSYAGHAAAYALAKRLTAKKVTVEVRLPPSVGMDWNDVLLTQIHEQRSAA